MKKGLFRVVLVALALAQTASAQTGASAARADTTDPLGNLVIEVTPVARLRDLPPAQPSEPVQRKPAGPPEPQVVVQAAAPVQEPDATPERLMTVSASPATLPATPAHTSVQPIDRLARRMLAYPLDRIGSARARAALAGGVVLLVLALLLVSIRARRKRRRTNGTEADAPQLVLPGRASAPDPERVAAETRAAVWAARTMAGAGLDAGAIARRTGLARDATTLLVARARPIVPGPAGSSPPSPGADHRRPSFVRS